MSTDSTSASSYSQQEVVRIARHVTWVGFWVNAILAAMKIVAGIIGRSSAMVADGIHSLSDFVTDVIVIAMIGISRKKADTTYTYGHGKYETLATMIISMALAIVAIMIFYEGIVKIIMTIRGDILPRPGMVALIMAVVSIVAKESLYHYTRIWGERISSGAVIANAWHHRSDAISSIATLLGIAGAMFMGEHWRILDPIAAIVVSIFILIVAVRIGMPSVRELLEVSLPREITDPMHDIVRMTHGVITYHHFRSRRNGNNLIIDMHIKVDPDITVVEGHRIASDLERNLRKRFGQSMIINIHVEPYRGERINPADGSCKD